jgi:HlyD family secretion protein
VTGIIDSIFFKEGDSLIKNNIILTIRDTTLMEKKQLNEMQISQCREFIHDLELLTKSRISDQLIPLLKSQLYKQETRRFISRLAEQEIMLRGARHDKNLNEKLARDKVISPSAFYEIMMREQKQISGYQTFRNEQFTAWQNDLVRYQSDLKQYLSGQVELNQQYETDQIRATVAGWLQDLSGHYTGNTIQAGERICSISPGGVLIGECYVSSKDIGMLKTGQLVRFQVDAFNYTYFGEATGNIYAIDKDFTVLDKTPVFKIKCRINERVLKLSNGYSGELKKGMNFRARFYTCNRTLWQLLYDGLDDWLNPTR